MIKNSFLFLALIFSTSTTNAQHCGYDFAAILLVDIVDKKSKEVVEGLGVTLLDSEGNPVLEKYYRNGSSGPDTLRFFHKNESGETNMYRFEYKDIWIIEDSYGLIQNYQTDLSKSKVLIHDPQGRYKDKTVNLNQENLFHLCTDAHDWYYRKNRSRERIEGLEIIEVKL